jgi:quinol monooxygenase YgiN
LNSRRVRLVLGLDIHEGKFLEFQKVAQQMVVATEREGGTLTYLFLLDADRKHCRLIETYDDVPAIAAHFQGSAVQEFVPQLLEVASLTTVEFHGDPGPDVLANAAQLKPAVYEPWMGFDR